MNKTVICHAQNRTSNVDRAAVAFCPVGHAMVNQIVVMEVTKIQIFAVSELDIIKIWPISYISKL